MEYSNFDNGIVTCKQTKTNASGKLCSAISNGHLEEDGTAANEETVRMCKIKHDQNGSIANDEHSQMGSTAHDKHGQNGSLSNGKHVQNGPTANYEPGQNGMASENATSNQTVTNGKCIDGANEFQCSYSKSEAMLMAKRNHNEERIPNNAHPYSKNHEKLIMRDHNLISKRENDSSRNSKRLLNSVVVNDRLKAEDLQRLFSDQICVLHIPNYVPQVVCDKLDSFLQEKGSAQYTHEIRGKDGTADLQYFGVNRYGFPLNSTYNDSTGDSLKRYFTEALPTMQSIRSAAAPYLSPIDKLRVELDELWYRNVNVATLNARKTFCGIGRIMPAVLSELSADQPHFDAVPTSYFPNIHKQFAANIYLNVPEEGGELEIWDVPPVDVENVENFTIPEDWRSKLPESIKVKPGPGDLLLLNTRRPHAITKFTGTKPRTSIQSFIGFTKESDVFLWV